MPAVLEFPRRLRRCVVPGGEGGRHGGEPGPVSALRARLPDVRATGQPVNVGIDIPAVEYYLGEWARMRSEERGVSGYLGSTPGVASGVVSATFEEMYDRSVVEIVRHVDAVLPDLPLHEQAAINVEYGQANVYRFARIDQAKALADGKQHLGEKLRRRGVPL